MAPQKRKPQARFVVSSQSTPSAASVPSTSTAQASAVQSHETTGFARAVHPVWPEMAFVQGELFFECTLFLYSVLALFLQYLNLYKTLWWLPKSYWHYSMKIHHINPYFLSCVGLLLGMRVTRSFSNTISELITAFAEGASITTHKILIGLEYTIKLPVMTAIATSFLFSFSRIVKEFPTSSVIFFFFPPMMSLCLFRHEVMHRIRQVLLSIQRAFKGEVSFVTVLETMVADDLHCVDIDGVQHMCSPQAGHIREEANVLISDVIFRLKRCLYAGANTSFLSIALPLVFVPHKTSLDMPQSILVSESWEIQMGLIVFCTAFTHYVTYLFPLNYIDLLYRSSMHLGRWEEVREEAEEFRWAAPKRTTEVNYETWFASNEPYPTGARVRARSGKLYRAHGHELLKTVAAEPENTRHAWLTYWCEEPRSLMNVLCMSELVLILLQFWLLLLTTEWQHIVTLVLLMFTNYLLLAKLFKDWVILGRIYEPSPEDVALIRQVQEESLGPRKHQ